MNGTSLLPIVIAFGALLPTATGQRGQSTQPTETQPTETQPTETQATQASPDAGVVVVEHGDDRVEVKLVPGAEHPTVTINGKVIDDDAWHVEDGEHRIRSGKYRLRVTSPTGRWLAWPQGSTFGQIGAPALLDWSKAYYQQHAQRGEPEPYIGVQVSAVSEALADHLGLDVANCVLVVSVVDGGPAATAGLKAHDVLTAIDGVEGVTDAKLSAAVDTKHPGDTLTLSIVRRGERRDVAIEVGKQTRVAGWQTNWQQLLKYNRDNNLLLSAPQTLLNLTTTDAQGRWATPLLQYYTGQQAARAAEQKEPEPSVQEQIDEIRALVERIEKQLQQRRGDTK